MTDPECGQQVATDWAHCPKEMSLPGVAEEYLAQLANMLTMQTISALQPLAACTIKGQTGGPSSLGPSFTKIWSMEWLAEVSAPVSSAIQALSGAAHRGSLGQGGDLQTRDKDAGRHRTACHQEGTRT